MQFFSSKETRMTTPQPPIIAAEALLLRLKAHGIDYLFANGGTDFAPIIEAYVTGGAKGSAMPQPSSFRMKPQRWPWPMATTSRLGGRRR
jgi:hypothetical protein